MDKSFQPTRSRLEQMAKSSDIQDQAEWILACEQEVSLHSKCLCLSLFLSHKMFQFLVYQRLLV